MRTLLISFTLVLSWTVATAQAEDDWAVMYEPVAASDTSSYLGEGALYFSNFLVPTRIGSIDGPLAGPDIWAQLFAGLTPETLMPLGMPIAHNSFGWFLGPILTVPGSDAYGTAYAQMYVWDTQMWGTEFNDVPAEWLGSTDLVAVWLASSEGYGPPAREPVFTRPAVVPIPEPSTIALTAIAGTLWFLLRRRSVVGVR